MSIRLFLGLNGSGKTTLLNMINGYIFPSQGELTVLGKTFGEYDLRELRKSIGTGYYSFTGKIVWQGYCFGNCIKRKICHNWFI